MIGFLLNPRVIASLALVGVLAFTHLSAYRKGASNVRTEWLAATAQANAEARKLEQQRQRRADDVARIAASREAALRSAAIAARRELGGLRDDLSAVELYAQQSRAAAERATGVLSRVFEQCVREYLDMAEAAQRADNEARALREAWPK